jgi:hypothetical protein
MIPEEKEHPPFELQHTNTEEVTKTMNKINPNKASDIYKIKPALIKDLTPFLAPILTDLFNQAIDEHEYPDPLKATKVIEIYKKADRTLPQNYRPISLLPIIAKLFDTIINNQMMAHLLSNNIISDTQYAFRPNSSTTSALQTIINKIHKHKSQKQPTLAIYIDLSKIYDTAQTTPSQTTTRLQLHRKHNQFLRLLLPQPTPIDTYTTSEIQDKDHNTRNPTRQYTINNLLPPLHQ